MAKCGRQCARILNGRIAKSGAAFKSLTAVDEPCKKNLLDRTSTINGAASCRPRSFHGTKGRTTLIGDAAHAMLPFLAQGAAQATTDAAALADCLEAADDGSVGEALQRYEDLRRPRANRILIGSAAGRFATTCPMGPNSVGATRSSQRGSAPAERLALWIADLRSVRMHRFPRFRYRSRIRGTAGSRV